MTGRDAALVNQFRPERQPVRFAERSGRSTEIASLVYCPRSKEIVLALRNTQPERAVVGGRTYTLHTLPSRYLEGSPVRRDVLSLQGLAGPYAAFGCPVSSISLAETGGDILVFAVAQERASPGNVFSTRLMPYDWGPERGNARSPFQMTTSNFATLGTTSATALWQTSINPSQDTVAVAGTLGVWSLDLECTPKDRLSITRRDYAEPEDDETRAVDWLDHHTIAAGSGQIYLWDQRSGGASQRFRCKGRVTGIQNPDRGLLAGEDGGGWAGQTLLVSTNRYINLFDVRYVSKSRPLLSWRHEHEGPQIALTANGQGLFAAADRDSYVHVYSTRTGSEVTRLRRPEDWRGKGTLASLQWYEDGDGRPGLRALQGGDVVEWSWTGMDD